MEEALQRSQGGDLKVSVLLDYSRGSRGSSLPPAALPACRLRGLLTLTHLSLISLLCRTGQLQDDAAAAAAPLHLADARLPVPHAGPAGAAAPAHPAALQRDHRRPAHQGLPVRRQRHHQRVRLCFSTLVTHKASWETPETKQKNHFHTPVCDLKKEKQPTQTAEQNPTKMKTSIFSSFFEQGHFNVNHCCVFFCFVF